MKKALVLALTVLMVLSLATAAFAAEVTYEGKVGVRWSNKEITGAKEKVDGFAQDSLEAKVVVDYKKDYGDDVTAGVKVKSEAQNADKKFVFDGAGWIQLEKDLFTLKAATGINDQVGKDLKEFKIEELPGVNLKLNLIDGLTVNTILNAGSDYNYLLKGEFVQDLFTVGGGFQNNNKDGKVQQAFGIYGSADVIDGLTIKAEYGNRNLDKENKDNKAITSILASAGYKVDALDVKGSFLMNDAGFKSAHKDDIEEVWRINGAYRWADDKNLSIYDVTVIFADASYKVTDDFEVNGYFDYLLSVKDAEGKALARAVEDKIDKTSYKVGAAYTMDDLKFEGWYKAYVDSQVGAKATYKLVDGVETSFELDYDMFKEKDENGNESAVKYTAKIEAKF